MCRVCSLTVPYEPMQETRNKRYHQELRDLAQGIGLPSGQKVECGKCKNELKGGVRWWVCSKCKGECRSKVHPPWVGKLKEPDLEMGEMEETKGKKEWKRWSHM